MNQILSDLSLSLAKMLEIDKKLGTGGLL